MTTASPLPMPALTRCDDLVDEVADRPPSPLSKCEIMCLAARHGCTIQRATPFVDVLMQRDEFLACWYIQKCIIFPAIYEAEIACILRMKNPEMVFDALFTTRLATFAHQVRLVESLLQCRVQNYDFKRIIGFLADKNLLTLQHTYSASMFRHIPLGNGRYQGHWNTDLIHALFDKGLIPSEPEVLARGISRLVHDGFRDTALFLLPPSQDDDESGIKLVLPLRGLTRSDVKPGDWIRDCLAKNPCTRFSICSETFKRLLSDGELEFMVEQWPCFLAVNRDFGLARLLVDARCMAGLRNAWVASQLTVHDVFHAFQTHADTSFIQFLGEQMLIWDRPEVSCFPIPGPYDTIERVTGQQMVATISQLREHGAWSVKFAEYMRETFEMIPNCRKQHMLVRSPELAAWMEENELFIDDADANDRKSQRDDEDDYGFIVDFYD